MLLTICNKNDFESALNDTAMLMEKSVKNKLDCKHKNEDTTFIDTNIFDACSHTKRDSNKDYNFDAFKRDLKDFKEIDEFNFDNMLNDISYHDFKVEDIEIQKMPYRLSNDNYQNSFKHQLLHQLVPLFLIDCDW